MKTIKRLFKGLLIMIAFFLAIGLLTDTETSPAGQANADVQRTLKNYVTGKVKDPQSILYGEYNTKAVGSNTLLVSLGFSSENSFGARIYNTVYANVVITDSFEITEIKNTKIK